MSRVKEIIDSLVQRLSNRNELLSSGVASGSATSVAFNGHEPTIAKTFRDQLNLVDSSVTLTLESLLDVVYDNHIASLRSEMNEIKLFTLVPNYAHEYFKTVRHTPLGLKVILTDPFELNEFAVEVKYITLESKLKLMETIEKIVNTI